MSNILKLVNKVNLNNSNAFLKYDNKNNILDINLHQPLTIRINGEINIESDDINITPTNLNIDTLNLTNSNINEIEKYLEHNPNFNLDELFQLFGGKISFNGLSTSKYKDEFWALELKSRQEDLVKKLINPILEISDKKIAELSNRVQYLESKIPKEVIIE